MVVIRYDPSVTLRYAWIAIALLGSGCGLLFDLDAPEDAAARDATVRDATTLADRACLATAETCNGLDDDCDERVDEDADVCDPGQACVEGACVCDGALCDDECVDLDSDPRHCGGCGAACDGVCSEGACCVPQSPPIDVLLVIDTSNSMVEEQGAFGSLLRSFLERWDAPLGSLPALDSVHVGVITPDLGSAFTLPGCTAEGENGEMQTRSRGGACAGDVFPRFLSFTPDRGERDRAEEFLRCVMQVGTGGCGFEQPLEASLKALTPSASGRRFFQNTPGLGDTTHDGFLRPDSILVIAVVTDEDDCSIEDPELMNSSSTTYSGSLNLRCHEHPEALHRLLRYREGLAEIHPPEDTILLVIGGVPPRLVEADAGTILDAPEMQETVDASMNRLVASCTSGSGDAYPPRRLVELAGEIQGDGGAAIFGSVCAPGLGAPLERTLEAIADRYELACASP